MKPDADQYRREIVQRLAMSQDEQTLCWALLGELQIAVIANNEGVRDRTVAKIEKYVTWARSPKGSAWLRENYHNDPEFDV